jgi:signal transduction histidine kinase
LNADGLGATDVVSSLTYSVCQSTCCTTDAAGGLDAQLLLVAGEISRQFNATSHLAEAWQPLLTRVRMVLGLRSASLVERGSTTVAGEAAGASRIWTSSADQTARQADTTDIAGREDGRLSIPIYVGPFVWGTLHLQAAEPDRRWHTWELRFVRLIAEMIASGVQREEARLRETIAHTIRRKSTFTAPDRQAPAQPSLARHDGLLHALTSAMTRLLEDDDITQAVPWALSVLAHAGGFHRAGVIQNFERDGKPCWRVLYEWADDEFAMQSTGPHAEGAWGDGPPGIYELLASGMTLNCTRDTTSAPIARMMEVISAHTTINAPINIAGQFWGVLAFDDCRQARLRSEDEKNALLAAARAFGMAIHRYHANADRAEMARHMARAADARLAELMQVNQALRDNLALLINVTDQRDFIRCAMAGISEQLGATGAALFRYDPAAHTLRMAEQAPSSASVELSPESLSDFTRPVPADITPYWRTLLAHGGPFVLDAEDPLQQYLFWPGTRKWHIERGQPISVGIALQVGDEAVGFIGVLFDGRVSLSDVQLAQAQALARQVALAIHLQRLSDRASQAAVAQEREQAAEQRAAEAERLSRMLGGVVTAGRHLLDGATYEEAVSQCLATLGRAFGAQRVAIGHYVPEPGYDVPMAVFRIGWNPDGAPSERVGERVPRTADVDRCAVALLRGESNWIRREDLTDPATLDYWRLTGTQTVLVCGVAIDRKNLGWLYFSFADSRPRDETTIAAVHTAATAIAAAERRWDAQRTADAERTARQAAVLSERSRMAREIHDTIAQGLLGIMMQARSLLAEAGEHDPRLRTIERLATHYMAEARQAVHALREDLSHARDLSESMSRTIARMARNAERAITFSVDRAGMTPDVPADVHENLLRIAEEAITNALRHAGPQAAVTVELSGTAASGVRLLIYDNGVGFDTAEYTDGRWGLIGMQERADKISAMLTIVSEPERGTTIIVTWHASTGAST